MDATDLVDKLHAACRGGATAIRFTARLMPAGGAGDKVFPPTHPPTPDKRVYAHEERLIDGEKVPAVLLDSVQSQANRMEEALLEASDAGEIALPVLAVRIAAYGRVTALDAPHRIYDAIFRDSLLEGVPFRQSTLGERLLAANVRNATALYALCPTTLIFGGWDSHGEGGGRGAKIPRALVSEIVGLNAIVGERTSSRIDPLGITLGAGPIYESAAEKERWTLDPDAAKKDKKGEPQRYKGGRPSEIGHSNIAPSIEKGGVTLAEARQTAVLSFPQLRRLRFPDPDTGDLSTERDVACRAVLAALALCGLALQLERGYDLRSRCLLLPLEAPRFELLGGTADEVEPFALDAATARAALALAVERAGAQGVRWDLNPPELQAHPKLEELVRRSAVQVAPLDAE